MITRSATNSQRLRPMSVSFGKAIAFTLALTCAAYGQTTHYVDDDNCPAPGTGSLVDPYCSIQVAIVASLDGDTVEVAPGTYFESINFLGKAITLRSRDGAATTTIDATNVPDLGSGVSVVRCISGETAATVLDGFMITGGTGDTSHFPFFNSSGGGMFNYESSPTVTNCIFTRNSGSLGGGMYNKKSSSTVTNCTFSRNMGSGMSNVQSYNLTVTNCTFSENESASGGGMLNTYSAPMVRNCMFIRNSTNLRGSGMYNVFSDPIVINCTFRSNTGANGGGMYNLGSSSTVTNCTFIGNSATFRTGGGMFNGRSSTTVTNCTFIGNSAAQRGGGMNNESSSNTTVTNCTFIGNTAIVNGGGMHNVFSSNPTVTNCIMWGDSPNEIFNDNSHGNSMPTIAYSDIAGSGSSVSWNPLLGLDGGGNIDADPLFVRYPDHGPDGEWDGVDDDYGDLRLQDISPCIDAADNNAVPIDIATDFDGKPRFVDDRSIPDTGLGISPIVDMGAYEFQVTIDINIDIKPGGCPNTVNRRSRGVLPVAIVGSLDFDVSEIDFDSLTLSRGNGVGMSVPPLNGSKGPGIVIEDVATPIDDETCECHDFGGDGVDDLLLKFSTPELVNALQLGSLPRNATIELIMQGDLLDGTAFAGVDCIVVKGKARVFNVIRAIDKVR